MASSHPINKFQFLNCLHYFFTVKNKNKIWQLRCSDQVRFVSYCFSIPVQVQRAAGSKVKGGIAQVAGGIPGRLWARPRPHPTPPHPASWLCFCLARCLQSRVSTKMTCRMTLFSFSSTRSATSTTSRGTTEDRLRPTSSSTGPTTDWTMSSVSETTSQTA